VFLGVFHCAGVFLSWGIHSDFNRKCDQ
jgi:hypothetical protein